MTEKKIKFDKKDIVKFINMSKKTRECLFNSWNKQDIRDWFKELDKIIEIMHKQNIKEV